MLPSLEVQQMDKTIVPGSTLYAAATESLVSEASATSTFEKMIQVAFSHSTGETFAKEIKEVERQIRKDFEITSMPGPWRSAKSVIQGAMKLNIKLVDENGTYCGKTYLQNKIKEMKSETKTEITEEEYSTKICKMISDVPKELDASKVRSLVIAFLGI
jgi:hypothetical protein